MLHVTMKGGRSTFFDHLAAPHDRDAVGHT